MSRILGIRVIKPRRRLQNGTLQLVIFHRPGVIDPQREGKRGVVMRANPDRVRQLTEVIHQTVANVLR